MNIFLQWVTKTSNVLKKYFSVQYYYLYYYYFIIFYFLRCSIDCKYEYFCTTGNRNFKRVFLKSILFELANRTSHVLVDRLTWNLEEIFTGCIFFIVWTTDYKIWCFLLFFFFSTFKRRKTQGKKIFRLRNAAVSLIFEISLFQWYML